MALLLPTFFSWLGLLALAFCFAVLVFRLPFFYSATQRPSGGEILSRGLWRLFVVGIGAIAVSSLVELAYRTAQMSGLPIESVFHALPLVIQHSHYGTVWTVRIICLLVLLMGVLLPRNYQQSTLARYAMLVVAVLLAWTQSASGHPSDQGDFTLQELMDLLHLLSACIWGGGIFVLSLLIIPSLSRRGEIASLSEVSREFSTLAGYAVLVTIVTALYNVWNYIGDFASLWKTGYGITTVVKMVLLYFLLLLGAFNRYISVPLLQHVAGIRFGGIGFLAHVAATVFDLFRGQLSGSIAFVFRKAVLFEALLMAAVLLATALLKHETPARHLRHLEHERIEQKLQVSYPADLASRHDSSRGFRAERKR